MKEGADTVIIVSEFVSSKQNSTGYYWSGIINKAAEDFKTVRVVCSTLPEYEKKNELVQYDEVSSLPYNKKQLVGLVRRLFTEIRLSWQFFIRTRKNIKLNTILFTGTNPPVFLFLIFLLKKTRNFKWVILVHDVFPENLVTANAISQANLVYKLTKRLFDRVYSSSDSMIVIGRDMKELMEIKTKQQVEIIYISNWASSSDINLIPRESSVYLKELGWSKYVVFQFFGNLGRVQDIPNILEAITLVKSSKAAFLFIGSGVMKKYTQEFIAKHKDLKIVYLGEINAEYRSEALSACDVAIVSLSKGMKGLGVPSKAYFSMAADKPLLVVSDDGSELARVVSDLGVGWHCNSGAPATLACMIDDICEVDLSEKKGKIYSVFRKNFSDRISVGKISNVLKNQCKYQDESLHR